VECLARDDAPAVLDLVVGYVVHARMARHVALLLVVRLNLTEELRRGRELVRRKVLVAHDQHVMLDESAAQDGMVSGIDRLGEVELMLPSKREKDPEIAFSNPHGDTKAMCDKFTTLDPAANGSTAHAELFSDLIDGEESKGI
jgi:hypothetical protein